MNEAQAQETGRMDWFDPSDDVVIQPRVERARFWKRKYGTDRPEVAEQVLFVNNGHGDKHALRH